MSKGGLVAQAAAPPKLPQPQFGTLLVLGVIFINGFAIALGGLSLYESYQQHQKRAALTSQNIAELAAKKLQEDFNKINLSLLAVADEVDRQFAAGGEIDQQALNKFLQRLQTRLPEIESLRVADAAGMVRYAAGVPDGLQGNIADREYFALQRDNTKGGLVIARPVVTRIDGKYTIPISRRLIRPNATFAGVVYANLSTDHINKSFAEIDVGRAGSVALRNEGLALVARHPMLDSTLSEIGSKELFPEVKALMLAGQNTGTVISRYPADDIERTVSFRKVSDYPFYVLIGLAVDEYLAEWRMEAAKTLSAIACFFLSTILLGWWIFRSWRQQRTQKHLLVEQAHQISEDVIALEQAALKTRKLAQAVEQSPAIVVITDVQGSIEYINPKFTEVTGYTPEEALGKNPRILKSGLTLPEVYRDLWATILAGRQWHGELLNKKKSGELIWENTWISPLKGEDGKISHFITLKEDITERKQAEAALHLSNSAIEASSNGIIVIDAQSADRPIVYANPAFGQMTGYDVAEVLGQDIFHLLGCQEETALSDYLSSALRQGERRCSVVPTRRKDGTPFWNEFAITVVRNAEESISHYVGVLSDVTGRIEYEGQLTHQATHDELTGLANRSLLMDRIDQAIANAHRYGHSAAVLLVDLDRFKYINDSLGHAAGDQVVKEVAQRLSGCAREGDTVARMGGDEFVLVLNRVEDEQDVARVLQRIVDSISQPMLVEGRKLHITSSIGVSLFPKDGDNAENLLRYADTAMYRAKEQGRNGYWFYTADMNLRMMARLTLEGSLRHALEKQEFVLHYQPQMDIRTRRIIGAEALIRWQSPTLGMVPPGEFISLAEETGLIIPIGDWVLKNVCQQIKLWQAAGLPRIRVAVNISALQFRQNRFTSRVKALLDESRLEADNLELEITESMLMHDVEDAIDILRELKAIDLPLSLDDFGTGYSSLSYLKRFPIDVLKLDRSFVRDILVDPDDAAIAKTVIGLGHSLNLKVVAEGVETLEQYSFLESNGCDLVQGYLFSRPLPVETFEQFLKLNEWPIKNRIISSDNSQKVE